MATGDYGGWNWIFNPALATYQAYNDAVTDSEEHAATKTRQQVKDAQAASQVQQIEGKTKERQHEAKAAQEKAPKSMSTPVKAALEESPAVDSGSSSSSPEGMSTLTYTDQLSELTDSTPLRVAAVATIAAFLLWRLR